MYQSSVFVFILWVTVSKLCFLCFLTKSIDVTSLYLPQDGVNWLAFLNRYKLHGILCDGILYFVFDAFLRFIYVRQYITFLCPCSVQSFGALVLSVSVQMQRHPEFSVNYYERASYRILS